VGRCNDNNIEVRQELSGKVLKETNPRKNLCAFFLNNKLRKLNKKKKAI